MNKGINGNNINSPACTITEILVLLFLIYYAVMSLMAPVKKQEALVNEYGYIAGENQSVTDRLSTDSTYLSLFKQKSFLESRLIMAETDSIYLCIDLPDSTVHVEIGGVSVHLAAIIRYRAGRILNKGNEYVIASMLSKPLTIIKSYSSIPREPIMIKMAPRDTSEYQPDIIPDTADHKPVNFILEMDNGIRIYMYQFERDNYPRDRIRCFAFDLWHRIRLIFSTLKNLFLFRVPDYHPYIKIRLTANDARIVYRALPENGQVAVFR